MKQSLFGKIIAGWNVYESSLNWECEFKYCTEVITQHSHTSTIVDTEDSRVKRLKRMAYTYPFMRKTDLM